MDNSYKNEEDIQNKLQDKLEEEKNKINKKNFYYDKYKKRMMYKEEN